MPTPRRYWSEADVEKLRSLAGSRTIDDIARELRHPRGSVATKAYQLKLSLRVLGRRQQQNRGADDSSKEGTAHGPAQKAPTLE